MRASVWLAALGACGLGVLLLLAALAARWSVRGLGVEGLAGLSVPLAIGGTALVLAGGVALARLCRWEALRKRYNAVGTILGVTLAVWGLSALAVVPLVVLDPALSRKPVAMFLVSGAVLYGALLGSVYWLVVRPGLIPWQAMGLTRAGLRQVSPSIVVGAVATLFVLASASEALLRLLGIRQTQLEMLQWLRDVPPWQYLLVAFMAVVVAPIVEEVYFRGYVFRAVGSRYGLRAAYLFTSALFALVHLNAQALLPILVIALFLSYLYQRTGSIVPGIVAHAFNNGLAFVLLYFLR